MEIRVLGAHNLESRDTRHTCFLIDGVLGLDVGSLASALDLSEQERIQALLLTHHHFDHTRDIPTLGLARLDDPEPIHVYSLLETLDGVQAHLIDGDVYPDFTKALNNTPPKYQFHPVKPGVPFDVMDYQVRAISVPHPVPAVGYIVKDSSGACMAYTGDTGGDLLPFFQDPCPPQVFFVDVTFPNRLQWRAELTGHLTPSLLRSQLLEALKNNLTLPRIVPVHISLGDREEVTQELASVSSELEIDLTPGYEDMVVV